MELSIRVILKRYVIAFVALSLIISSLFLPLEKASAIYHVNVDYFTGSGYTAAQTDCPVIEGGYWGGADANSFIAAIYAAYAYTDPSGCEGARNEGAAYIVHTMLGQGVGQPKTVSSGEWVEWEKRVRQSTIIDSSVNVLNQINTSAEYFSTVKIGQFIDVRNATFATLKFYDSKGNVVYEFKRQCANPIGDTKGLPVADYSLTPYINASDTAAVGGSTIALTPSVKNTKSGPSSGTQWQVSQFRPLVAYPTAGNSVSAPSPYYKNVITNVASGTGASYPANATSQQGVVNATVPDLPVGSLVCYAFSVQARANDSTEWAHSDAVCIKIAVKPLVQVWGGDLSAGKSFLGTSVAVPAANIETSTSTKTIAGTSYTFGAWVEYGIFATGTTKNIASAAAYAGTGATQGLANASLCKESYLSFNNASAFQNVCTGGAYKTVGAYATTRSIPDVGSNYPVTGGTPQFGSSDINSGSTQGLYTSSSDITLAGGTIGAGRWIVINAPDANVTIAGNITYTSAALSSVSDIPQMVIIAKNINIVDAVTQIDAWLIAKPSAALADGVINTCSSVLLTAQLSSVICPKPLVVNGPIMANKLYLRRTTGPGTGVASGNPAETFNLRADAYLWAYAHTTSNGRVQTVYTTELPPRL